MQTVAVIPARFRSSRFPGKPLALIDGKLMIVHVYEKARMIRNVDFVIVATDSEDIAEPIREKGGLVVMTSTRHQSGTDRVAEVCRNMGDNVVVLNVQGDLPFFDPEVGEALINRLLTDSAADISTPIIKSNHTEDALDKNKVKVAVAEDGRALFFSRSPIPHYRYSPAGGLFWNMHIGVYCYRNKSLQRFSDLPCSPLERSEGLEQLRALEAGMKIKCVLVDEDCGQEVNCPEDLKKIECGRNK